MDSGQSENDNSKEQGFFKEVVGDAFDIQVYGLWETLVSLFTKPRHVIEAYFRREETNFYSPYKYLFLTAAALAFVFFLAVDYDRYMENIIQSNLPEEVFEDDERQQLVEDIQRNFIIVNRKIEQQFSALTAVLLWLPSCALFSFIFFRKSYGKFKNHIAFNAYLIGQASVIQLILCIPLFFIDLSTENLAMYLHTFLLVSILYLFYAYHQLFYDKKAGSVIKSIIAPLFGYITSGLMVTVISLIIAIGMAMVSHK